MPILKKVSSHCVLGGDYIVVLVFIIPAAFLSGREFRSKARTYTRMV